MIVCALILMGIRFCVLGALGISYSDLAAGDDEFKGEGFAEIHYGGYR